jgi:hypothetical protein
MLNVAAPVVARLPPRTAADGPIDAPYQALQVPPSILTGDHLERCCMIDTPGATHIRYRVRR